MQYSCCCFIFFKLFLIFIFLPWSLLYIIFITFISPKQFKIAYGYRIERVSLHLINIVYIRVHNIFMNSFFFSKKKKKTISTIKSCFKKLKTCLENFFILSLVLLHLHFIFFIVVHFKDHGVLSICFASFSLPFVVVLIVVIVVDSAAGSGQVQSAIMERLFLVLFAVSIVVVVMLLEILCIVCSLQRRNEVI